MHILEHFDIIAPYYEKVIRANDASRLIALMRLPIEDYVLDAGGGTGRISQHFPHNKERVIIADLSIPMLAASKSKSDLIPVCARCEKLPFENDFFEAICMVDALHHVFDQEQTCRELWRVLKPGGRLVIEEPDVDRFAVKILALVEKLLLMRSRFLPPERIAAFFQDKLGSTQIIKESFNAWIVYEKLVNSNH
jgi:ubiquinone/menaquinone biosynthesis C-methylase UbiE